MRPSGVSAPYAVVSIDFASVERSKGSLGADAGTGCGNDP
jgi:hypothetical protein